MQPVAPILVGERASERAKERKKGSEREKERDIRAQTLCVRSIGLEAKQCAAGVARSGEECRTCVRVPVRDIRVTAAAAVQRAGVRLFMRVD